MNKMKKSIILLIILLLLFSFSMTALSADITVMVNNELLNTDVVPVIMENRTLVPMRAICEKLGAAVDYKQEDMSVTIRKGNTTIVLYLNSKNAFVNGESFLLDIVPAVINQRTMLPLRFIGEKLACTVNWLPEQNMVTVNSEVVEAAALATELLQLINEKRTAIGLTPFVQVAPLYNMAYLQTREMAFLNNFSPISPTRGDLNQRALQAGLINVNEMTAHGYYDAKSIWNAWIAEPAYKELLYGKESYFVGVYACYAPSNGANDLFVCFDLCLGDGFFVDVRSGISKDGKVQLHGFVYNENTRMVVYTLNPANPELYLSRSSYYLSPMQDKSFTTELVLPVGYLYAIWLGNDKLIMDTR